MPALTQVTLEHCPLHSRSAALHGPPRKWTPGGASVLWETEGVETHRAPFWRWKTHCKGAAQHEGSVERTEGSTHNWTQGHQLPDGGHAVTGSFKGRTAQKPSEEMLKEKFKNKKGEGSTAHRKVAAWGNDCSYSSWKYGSLKQGSDCNKRGRIR